MKQASILNRRPHPLIVLCLATSLLVMAHGAATPVFEAPDEVWHYAYVRWIAEGHGLPRLADDDSGANQQAAQPPLYYLVAAAISHPFDDDDLSTVMWHNPGFGYQAAATSADNKNMLIHPSDQAVTWRGGVLAVHVARLASWLFGILTVCVTYALGLETFGSRRWALVTAALVAFQPQFVFMAGVTSNDSAAAAIAALVLWSAIRVVYRGVTWRRAMAAGFIAGLAMLTKTSLLPAVPFLALSLMASAWLHAPVRRPVGQNSYTAKVSGYLAVFLLATLLTGGWWYMRNLIQFGDLLSLQHHTATMWARSEPLTLAGLLSELPVLFTSYWAAYGWGHVTWPSAVYILLGVLTLPFLAWSLFTTARAWLDVIGGRITHVTTRRRHALRRATCAGAPLPAATLSTVWFAGIFVALLRWMMLVEAPHGRLLFPALSAWALLIALGLYSVKAGPSASFLRRLDPTRLVLASMLAVAAMAPGMRILPTFALPRLRSPEEVLSSCRHPLELAYHMPAGGAAHLLCADVDRTRVRPGDTLSVHACWSASQPISEDYTVFVHLIGPENARVAERHTFPGLGRYPTSLWTVGGAFCDTYTLPIADWAEAPMRYWLEVGLFDDETGSRAEAEIEPPIVGAVTVASGATPRPAPATLAAFGDPLDPHIVLASASFPTQAGVGDTLAVTLDWYATGTPQRDYTAFVHLWRPGDTTPMAQHDAQPGNGWYPTTLWRAGDVIADTHLIALPRNLPPGTYPLWAGLYDPENGTRLVASNGDRLLHDLVPLGELEVQP